MISWLRLILSILAVAGLLAAAPGAAVAKSKQSPAHHHCVGMTHEQHCPGGDHGALPACCVAAVCTMVQPVFSEQALVLKHFVSRQAALPLLDDVWRSGVRPPPDLRPPIA